MACKSGNTLIRLVVCVAFCAALFVFASSALAGPSAHVSSETPAEPVDGAVSVSPGYLIGTGDVLRIVVFDEAEMSGEYTVDGAGGIAFPLVGRVSVEGLSPQEVSDNLSVLLSKGYLVDPRVNVGILRFRPFYILGEIRRPGSYDYVQGLTVLNAIALSGGFTYRARRSDVSVLRKQKDGTFVALEIGPEERVLPGDVIEVKERFF